MVGRFFGGDEPSVSAEVRPGPSAAQESPHTPTAPGGGRERRLALVIGNGRYREEPLDNAVADADLLGRVLPALGFETTRIENATAEALRAGVMGFANRVALAGPGAVAFVYYAGHGIQVGGVNYLLPVDVRPDELTAREATLLPLSQVVALLVAARPKAAALAIDACRNAPAGFQPLSGGVTGSAAAGDRPPDGMLIAYSTAAGAMAGDGVHRNGPYASALAQELPRLLEPGVRIHDVFVSAGERVRAETGGAQSPAIYLQGALPVLSVTDEDLTRFRTWNFDRKAGSGARLLQAVGVAALGVVVLSSAVAWFGADPEVRARRLHDLGLRRTAMFDFDCHRTQSDRFGLVSSEWCRKPAKDLVAPIKAAGLWNDRVVGPAARGDPAALLLLAEEHASGPQPDIPAALALALRAGRVGWLPAWETVARLQSTLPRTATSAEPAEILAGLDQAGAAGIVPADIVAAWTDWGGGRVADAETRFRRADERDPSGAAARWHGEALLRGAPSAGRAPDVAAAARRLLAACAKGDADAALSLLSLDDQRVQGIDSRELTRCIDTAAAGEGTEAAYLRALVRLRAPARPDPNEMRRLLDIASSAGHVPAMMMLAGLHASGDAGFVRDPEAARALAERAAASGHLRAQTLLASILLDAPTGSADAGRARTLLETAVNAGDIEAALYLGNLHASGAFAESGWDKARMLAEHARSADAATFRQRAEADRLAARAERGALLDGLPPARATIGPADAPMRLAVMVPVPCPGCSEVMSELLPRILASHVDAGLLAIDLRAAPAAVSKPPASLSACMAAVAAEAERWRDAVAGSPAWQALASPMRDEARLALGQLSLESACGSSGDDALSGFGRGGRPVLVVNGSLLETTTIDSARRGLVDAAPPDLRRRLIDAGLDGRFPPESRSAPP